MKKLITMDVLTGKKTVDERIKEIGWYELDKEYIYNNLIKKTVEKAIKDCNSSGEELAAGVFLTCFYDDLTDERCVYTQNMMHKILDKTLGYMLKEVCSPKVCEMIRSEFDKDLK